MKNNKTVNRVVARKNIPSNMPFTSTLVVVLAMDYWGASGWLWGVVMTVLVIVWVVRVVTIWNEVQIPMDRE